jgi:diguanylate cyclase (GGDEF)-like protein/putative nucleotidyltransferase with HDIG domain
MTHKTGIAALGVAAAAVAFMVVVGLADFGRPALELHAMDVVYSVLLGGSGVACLVRAVRRAQGRAAWTLIGAGLLLWTVADVYYQLVIQSQSDPPYPSLTDYLYIGFYGSLIAGLVLLARGRRLKGAAWLEPTVGALGLATVWAWVVFDRTLASGQGGALDDAVTFAYPVLDLIPALIVLSVLSRSATTSRAWSLLGLGTGLIVVADSILIYQVSTEGYSAGGVLDAVWPAGAVVLAAAAWASTGDRRPKPARWLPVRSVVVPASLVAVTALLADHWHRLGTVTVSLAAATTLASIVWAISSYHDRVTAELFSREAANTDAVTGLANSRKLQADLEIAMRDAVDSRLTVVMLDLDGFKDYNDRFGHPAGDIMLRRVGRALADALDGVGAAYRLGGDEFCVVGGRRDGDVREGLGAMAASALTVRGEGFEITASYGSVEIPRDAATIEEAMRLADHRMYSRKESRRSSASWQVHDALMSALDERGGALFAHTRSVTDLAVGVAQHLGMSSDDVNLVEKAASLHDIGKLAIPSSVLEKPGPLDYDEWSLMRQHTVVGERIIAAAPALERVARIVRSSHERVDGQGYPDGLHGGEIPLTARIIFACDSFDAMCSVRAYHDARTPPEALAELRRCAGSQFDADVVEGLAAVLAEPDSLAPELAAVAGSAG